MKTLLRIALLAGIAGLGFWLWTVVFPSPQKLVLKLISHLAATVTVNSVDGTFTRAAKVSSLISYFSTDAEINYDVPGAGMHSLSGRDEIREAAAGGLANVSSLKVQFQDAVAQVGPDKQTAEVSCTARVRANESQDTGLQELRFHLRKIEGDWLITRVESVKTLQ